jgi:tetratricopeptide (TPR) repeat protein
LGRYDEAISSYRDALRLHPEEAVVYNNLAWAYARRGGGTEEGIAFGEQALRLQPNEPSTRAALAELYSQKGEYGRVVEMLQKALTFRPGWTYAKERLKVFQELEGSKESQGGAIPFPSPENKEEQR